MSKKIRKRMPRAEARSAGLAGSPGFYSGTFGVESLAGSTVTPHTALGITAVWNAVNIYANTIAGLDRQVVERDARGGHSPAVDHPAYDLVHRRPNRVMTGFRFFQSVIHHKKTHGNAYAEIERARGRPVALHLMDPRNVTPQLDDSGALWYRLQREHRDLPARDVVHFAGLGFDGLRGYSPVTIARESLGLALAQGDYAASIYGNSATPQGLVEFPGDPKQEAVSRFRDEWNRRHQGAQRAGTVGILFGGMKWVQTAFSPEDAQLLLSRNFSVAEVARLFNLPQHMLGNLDKATFGNIEEQNIQFYQLSLMPEIAEMEAELDLKLLEPGERRRFSVRTDVAGLLRGNLAAQTARDVSDFNNGFKSINEVLLRRGDNPIDHPNADKHFLPVNNLAALEDLGQAATTPPAAAPAPVELGEVDAARAAALAVDHALESLAGDAS